MAAGPELRGGLPRRESSRLAPFRGESGSHRRHETASVLVDARGLLSSGIGRYLREVLAVLFRDERFGRIELLGEPEAVRDFCAGMPHAEKARVRSYPYGFYSLRAQMEWLRLHVTGALVADVAFFPHYDAPLVALPARSVVTVHDLIHFKVVEAFPWWRRLAADVLLRRGVASAAEVITVSESTRQDLAERLPAFAEKINVVPNGVSALFEKPIGGSPSEYSPIEGPYLLCVGNRKPHKNLIVAIEVLAVLRDEAPELRLVLVGDVFRGWDGVLRRADDLGVRDRLVEVSKVSDAVLQSLYAGCEVLLFPSLYEGFGLPVLEAMASGAPVIASNSSSLPEVVGDAGLLVDPRDPYDMARGVLQLRRDSALRNELVRRGRERAARFSWEQTGLETADILHRVAEGRGVGSVG